MARSKRTLIVVMDGAHAHFYRIKGLDNGFSLEAARPALVSELKSFAREERSDKPGRSFGASGSSIRHAVEPHHDYHKLAKRAFAVSVTDVIQQLVLAMKIEKLVLVGPSRTLGELRTLLTGSARAKVAVEIARNLVHCEPNELSARLLGPLEDNGLLPRGKGTVTEPRMPRAGGKAALVTILFRDLEPADSVEKSIRSHARKLYRLFPRIHTCRAIVEGSHGHHRKGRLYRVTVDVRLPGHMITANSTGSQGLAQDDVFAAVRIAFDSVGRRVQDYARKRERRLQEQRSSSLLSQRAI